MCGTAATEEVAEALASAAAAATAGAGAAGGGAAISGRACMSDSLTTDRSIALVLAQPSSMPTGVDYGCGVAVLLAPLHNSASILCARVAPTTARAPGCEWIQRFVTPALLACNSPAGLRLLTPEWRLGNGGSRETKWWRMLCARGLACTQSARSLAQMRLVTAARPPARNTLRIFLGGTALALTRLLSMHPAVARRPDRSPVYHVC